MKPIQSILGNTRRADISFSASGKIDISSRIVRSLGIQKGDVLDIMVGGGEFYLYVSTPADNVFGRHEARCYPTQRSSRHFRANCRRLCKAVLQATATTGNASFAAGEPLLLNGRMAIPIITLKPL